MGLGVLKDQVMLIVWLVHVVAHLLKKFSECLLVIMTGNTLSHLEVHFRKIHSDRFRDKVLHKAHNKF